jgi:nucleotide-binding universal stress UspA family protein
MSPTILIGFDDRPQDADALALGVELARLTGSGLAVGHVVHEGPAVNLHHRAEMTGASDDDSLRRARSLLAPELEAITTFHRRSGGSVADELEDLARELDAFMIVVGPVHRGPIGRSLLGTTPVHLIHTATRPVAVAPPHYADSRDENAWPVVVGFDRSREANAALAVARAFADLSGRRLRVVTVAEVAVPAEAPELPGAGAKRRVVAEHAAAVLAQGVAAAGEGATGTLLEGDPAQELSAESVEAQMLVIGSRRGRMRRGALGGVPTALITASACPLVVLPRGVEPDTPVFALSQSQTRAAG